MPCSSTILEQVLLRISEQGNGYILSAICCCLLSDYLYHITIYIFIVRLRPGVLYHSYSTCFNDSDKARYYDYILLNVFLTQKNSVDNEIVSKHQ